MSGTSQCSRTVKALVAILALLASGCSAVKVFYTQLDWTLPSYVNTYVTLSDDQYMALRAHVVALQKWHCGAQLHEYAAWLRGVAAAVESQRVHRQALVRYSRDIERFWHALLEQAAPRIADVLYDASDAQLDELFDTFAARNHDIRVKLVDASPDDVEDELTDRLEKQLKRWFGSVTRRQHAAVALWNRQVSAWQSERLAMRKRWQQALRRALAERGDRARFEEQVTRLLRHPDQVWSETYRTYVQAYRVGFTALLEDLLAALTSGQRDHLTRRLRDLAADLEELACGPQLHPASLEGTPSNI